MKKAKNKLRSNHGKQIYWQKDSSLLAYVGNKFITFLFNFLNNTTFSDIYCCYCMLKTDLIDINKLKCNGWGQQAEILTYAVNKKTKIFEIGINYHGRTYEEGKKIRYFDVFSVIYWILITRFKKLFS